MNDYLWDKSGEPDPEVERLEGLLGARRYEREPLRLPSEVRIEALPQRSYIHSFFSRNAIATAVAAGIVLIAIGGIRLNSIRDNAASSSVVSQRMADNAQSQTQFRRLPNELPSIDGSAKTISHSHETADLVVASRRSLLKRYTRRTTANPRRRTETSKGTGNDALAENRMRVTDEQREAKDQLMIALRMTSTKLSVVRTKVHTMPGGGGGGTR